MTTSADFAQLENVLWGEIRRFVDSAAAPLPVKCLRTKMYQVRGDGSLDPNSVVDAKVAQKGEGMLGMYIPRGNNAEAATLLISDECSGVDNETWNMADSWTHRKLAIGNPYACNNFFFQGTMEGNKESHRKYANYEQLYRNVINIKATDSPNVKLGLVEQKVGKRPSNKIIIPGIITYVDYVQRRNTWDPVKQTIGLDGQFYLGSEVLMYPPDWLDQAESRPLLQDRRDSRD